MIEFDIDEPITDEEYNRLLDEPIEALRDCERNILLMGKRLEELGFPIHRICEQIRYEMQKRDCDEAFLQFITDFIRESNPQWMPSPIQYRQMNCKHVPELVIYKRRYKDKVTLRCRNCKLYMS